MEKPLVTIQCTAYNHEPYIRDCLEGFVRQKTNFPFEAIVHDDASTDNTAAIIREYAEKYPHIIKPIYQVDNQMSQGIDIYATYLDPNTHGEFVALCEGDDYWSDCNKLQAQVDFMYAHPDCVMCTHRVKTIDGQTGKAAGLIPNVPISSVELDAVSFLQLQYKTGYVFQTSSYLIKTTPFLEFDQNPPKFLTVAGVGDVPLLLWICTKGKIGYINKEMSCYRFQTPGSWSIERKEVSSTATMRTFINSYRMYYEFDLFTGHKYHAALLPMMKEAVQVLYHRSIVYHWQDIDWDEFIPLTAFDKLYWRYRAYRTKLKLVLVKHLNRQK